MELNKLDCRSYCILVVFLGILFTPGEAGFCICFFGVDLDTSFMDYFCFLDSIGTFIASVLLGNGIYKEENVFILCYMTIILILEIVYWGILLYTLIHVGVLMHYEFFLPAILWKGFQLWGLRYAFQYFKLLKNKTQ